MLVLLWSHFLSQLPGEAGPHQPHLRDKGCEGSPKVTPLLRDGAQASTHLSLTTSRGFPSLSHSEPDDLKEYAGEFLKMAVFIYINTCKEKLACPSFLKLKFSFKKIVDLNKKILIKQNTRGEWFFKYSTSIY